MTDDTSDAPGVSRRTLLRSGAAAAGGAALLPGVASAHECPRSPGFWAHHEWPDTVPDPFEIGGVTMSVEEWQSFLLAPSKGDKAHIVAKHLVATVLNFQFRGALPEGDPGCVDEPLSEFGGRTVRQIRLAAERWLDASSFDSPEPQRSWLAGGVDGEPLKDALDAFNNNRLGLDCDCDDKRDDGKDDKKHDDGKDGDDGKHDDGKGGHDGGPPGRGGGGPPGRGGGGPPGKGGPPGRRGPP